MSPSRSQTHRIAVAEFEPDRRIHTILLARDKRVQTTRAGKPYLSLWLGDKSGTISGRVWDNAEAIATRFEKGDFISLDAVCETYKGELQLRVTNLQRVSSDQVDLADFQATSKFDPHEMLASLTDLVRTAVVDGDVRRVLITILSDPEVSEGFLNAPAAMVNHHAYSAGLLEHTLSMCRLSHAIAVHYADYYPGRLNGDLLIAGALLHDIGKIWELSADVQIAYTDPGQLIGHIVMGTELISRTCAQLDLTGTELELRLKHLVLSHHGQPEFGAVVRPQTIEAQLLHFVDQIDSRANMYVTAIEAATGAWSDYVRPLHSRVFVGSERSSGPTTGASEGAVTPVSAPSPASQQARDEPGLSPAEPVSGQDQVVATPVLSSGLTPPDVSDVGSDGEPTGRDHRGEEVPFPDAPAAPADLTLDLFGSS